HGPAPARLPILPDVDSIVPLLRGTAYETEVLRLADAVLRHEFPVFDMVMETGPEIRWRRDYVHGLETGTEYFRRIPYLDRTRAGDHKLIWELNRHQHLVLLAQAWRLSGRGEYQREIAAQLESWLSENPFQRGINWASALEVAFRALSWIWVYHLAGESMGEDLRGRFLTALYQHGLHLENNLSIYFSPNTHLLGEALALEAIGVLMPCFPPAPRWAETGGRIVAGEMERQVLADGAHFEQSTYYHVYAFDMFLLHTLLATVTEAYGDKLDRMGDYLEALLGADRAIACFGDDDGGRLFHPYGRRDRFGRASLAAASILRNGRWGYMAADAAEMAAWWLGPKACTASPVPPRAPASRLFEKTGMAVLAAGETVVYMDAGQLGPFRGGHSHAGMLSIVVKRGEQEVLIDPGTYTYVSDPEWRDRFRGTAAHNTVRIGGADQAVPAGPFGWASPPGVAILAWSPDTPALEAECRYRGFRHCRRVAFEGPDCLMIADTVEGPAGEEDIELFWHCGQPVTPLGGGRFAIGAVAELTLPAELTGEIVEGDQWGWRSMVFGTKVPAPVIRATIRTRLPWSGRTVLRWK
ncbi:MAG: alginate lyase family protein, partial [Acidobacteriia bacterium]|nr:alginate lyase family protein [Terriglobia bacterium]